ncbi:NUDIX hydrolase [Chryseosolibacter indicus]|uniref:NUDIX domain-containing protein n=1 Tax=Chryseosolibacter indicus TaxID=2782351 RepID=A0ABS5VP81_9BACT|nr:NUDIX domain-containing protein [Chryseosolibacter indicus]MBT1702607.1 NUDIX domain-containing protein [Chryseosolibacter indicus]
MVKKRPVLKESEFFSKGQLYFLPHISIDCVIFGFHNNELKVLLLQWKETLKWCLPGGFIYRDEHVNDAAIRILKSRTGLEDVYLQQFYTFGDPQRDRGNHGVKQKKNSWINDRFITIGYWAIVEYSQVKPTADEFSKTCEWWDIDKVPKLILDHNDILKEALESLRKNVNEYPVGKNLLPPKFTMPDLQRLYETLLGKKLDRRNFQKKMLSLDILQRLKERKSGVAHKAPYLYKFDEKKYQRALKQGLKFGL